QKQMITAGYNYTTTSTKLSIEAVYTKNDINTYSRFDKANDDGYGTKISFLQNLKATSQYSLQIEQDYEYVSQNFSYIQRYR
ncbi:hypothetical protein, partial [Salmonella enterica]|uniref:hypothetical protein n=1 Tax=Salmonella enterica TaxID=28901 RepID=UPI0020C21B8B